MLVLKIIEKSFRKVKGAGMVFCQLSLFCTKPPFRTSGASYSSVCFAEGHDWLGCFGKHLKAHGFRSLREYQKVGG